MAENRILASLPRDEAKRLGPHLEPVALTVKQPLFEPNRPIRDVYFLDEGVASVTTVMQQGREVEVATVGNEGMVGIAIFLGADSTPAKAFVQIPGSARKMPAAALRDAVERRGMLHHLLQRYTHALFSQVAQSAGCNRLHGIEERCSRWLLMTHDRVQRDEFPLTQEYLARMLGVRRATVTEAAGTLQRAGLIRYRRGQVEIVDRGGLETASCECYATVRREFDRLFADARKRPTRGATTRRRSASART